MSRLYLQRKTKNKKNKRATINKVNRNHYAQAALDYLVSWGWILIIIVLALVILYSFGVFKVPPAPTIISGFKGITMQAAEANSTMMVVRITNNYNQFVNITGITVTLNNNTYKSTECLNTLIPTDQSTLCRIPVSITTKSYLSKIQISFTPYKSRIYEVSNGTVSSTLVSGPIPLNNQLTYFLERGLPYGSKFTVNYNTSTNSTIISSVNDNVSFNLPFGIYSFSVPSVTYQGCISTPKPAAGTHSTGIEETIQFISNCTTTFNEKGLPSSQIWSVTYNGSIASNSTNSPIYIKTENADNAQISYKAVAKSNNLVCVSYKTPQIRLGGSYTFSAWNCTTTFSESGLPGGESWYVTNYNGVASSTTGTGSSISILEKDVNATAYPASASGYPLNQLNCNDEISGVVEGSSNNNFNPWTCTTTFTESALPSGGKWNASYNGSTDSFISVGSNAVFTRHNVVTVENYPASAVSDNLDCNSQLSSVQMGSTKQFTPWTCITTFNSGLPSSYNSYYWRITYTGTQSSYTAVTNPISITTTGITTVSNEPVTQGNVENLGCNYNATSVDYLEGSTNTFNVNYWNCVTTFSETGLGSGTGWAVIMGSNEPTGSSTSLSTSSVPGTYNVYIPGDLLTASGQKYIQSNSPSSILAGASSTISYSQQSPISVPSGVIFYIPVTISNAGNSQSIPSGFQQRIEFNANNYGEFESGNLQNVLFFTSSGQIINSWLELGNSSYSSTTYWLKLPFSIQPYSSAVIYMGFGLPSTNFFSMYSGQVGEAPQLSSTYAQYDNGANIFKVYANGDTSTSNFGVMTGTGSASVVQQTGVNYPGDSSKINVLYNSGDFFPVGYAGYTDAVYNATSLPDSALIVEANFNITEAEGSDNGIIGLTNYSQIPSAPGCFVDASVTSCSASNSPPLWSIGTQSGGQSTSCSSSSCHQLYQDYESDRYLETSCTYNVRTGRVCSYSAGGTYKDLQNGVGTVSGNWQYAELKYDGSSYYYSYVGGLPEYVDSSTGSSNTINSGFSFSGNHLYIDFLSWTSIGSAYAYKTAYNWIFARDYPPSGSMPSVSFGSITPVGYAEITGSSSQSYNFAVTWAGGDANIYWAAGSPGYVSYNLKNTLTGASISSASTTNWCIGSAATNINLPIDIYSVSGGTGSGGGQCSSPNYAVVALES